MLNVTNHERCKPKLPGGISSHQSEAAVPFGCSVMSDSLRPHGLSTPGFPVHHQLLHLAQTHVHWVGDAIQPSHPLSPPSPPALSLSQHQGLFQWVGSSHQVAKVLEFQLQPQSFQWAPRTDLLQEGPAGSPCSPLVSSQNGCRQRIYKRIWGRCGENETPLDHWCKCKLV